MIKNGYINWIIWAMILLAGGCVDPYRPPEITSPASYLVVNGFFNSASGTTTTIQLSRTQNLAETKVPTAETKAIVTIESAHKDVYTLKEGAVGFYTLTGVTPSADETYRLHIKTAKGNDYYSDYVPVIATPPIDSVSWRPDNDGLQISVNSHDPKNNTRYYRWEYDQTWEYNSVYPSVFEIKNNKIVNRPESVYRCWDSENSSTIVLGTTTRLSQDIISQYPLVYMPNSSVRLSVRYSILVRQFALSQTAYNYYDQLAKITQSIGSIFDPQPSQLTGNIRSQTDESDLVLGFFRVGTVESKRIFIDKSQLPPWTPNSGVGTCLVDTLSTGDILREQPGIIDHLEGPLYLTTNEACLDCRIRGGVIKKPDFW
ncbi:DUF4249 domain-containing protein [Spirosoma foliorum]|uniref:DUF4249 domain-containing protein n=1 Tax=Spirosoma foliorum TaxID=2710596 RepID=A0A7G5GZH8_9BACT|nr:DUF4249 domain-containing protein [Spirosoma foliorum]QMW04270.1 DUF4249 domain-containing protein [Spirosoma foliorum]